MKVYEVIKNDKKSLIKPSETDKKGKPLQLPSSYDNINYGKKKKVAPRTVKIQDTNTGKIYGRRTLDTKVVEQTLKEGGNIFKDQSGTPVTTRINRQNVDSTLQWLEQVTGLPLVDNKLGTTGEKPTSGDLDVAVDQTKVDKNQLTNNLKQWVKQNLPDQDPSQWVKKSGNSVHFKTPINGNPDNGFVQTDLMFGDPQWMKFSLAGSDVEDSPFKGKHRHILMNSVAKANGLKWSYTKGLVSRESGNVIATDPDHIAQILLGEDADKNDLRSVESILNKIKDNPDYDQMIADAKEVFEKEGLQLPSRANESFTAFLYKQYTD